jgi:hypothetical protein
LPLFHRGSDRSFLFRHLFRPFRVACLSSRNERGWFPNTGLFRCI